MKFKDQVFAELKIDGQTYSIRATAHAMQRMDERQVDEYVVTGNVMALGKDRLKELQEQGDDAVIIDEVRDIAVVFGFNKNKVTIITVINKSNIWVKDGTQIERFKKVQ